MTIIKTNLDKWSMTKASLSGYFQGKDTYLWIGTVGKKEALGVLSGHRLYRLAKAIVKQFEKG